MRQCVFGKQLKQKFNPLVQGANWFLSQLKTHSSPTAGFILEKTYLSEHIFQSKMIQKQLPRIHEPLVFGTLKSFKMTTPDQM